MGEEKLMSWGQEGERAGSSGLQEAKELGVAPLTPPPPAPTPARGGK